MNDIVEAAPNRCYIRYESNGETVFVTGGAGVPLEAIIKAIPEGAANVKELTEEELLQAHENPEAAMQRLLREYTALIQKRLDDFSRTKTYDSILSACTYATSTIPIFKAEGQYCVEARDRTWAAANSVLQAVLAKERLAPAWAELEAELPVLEWPVLG